MTFYTYANENFEKGTVRYISIFMTSFVCTIFMSIILSITNFLYIYLGLVSVPLLQPGLEKYITLFLIAVIITISVAWFPLSNEEVGKYARRWGITFLAIFLLFYYFITLPETIFQFLYSLDIFFVLIIVPVILSKFFLKTFKSIKK